MLNLFYYVVGGKSIYGLFKEGFKVSLHFKSLRRSSMVYN